jgi:ubiquitin-activating enzyme E1
MSESNTIDINLYDRQVRTYGVEAVKLMTTSSVLIYGLEGGLATEVAKNLALGGIKNIYLMDNDLNNSITKNDLDTGFYFNELEIGQIRSNVLVSKLQELNPYITVHSVNDINQNQNVTILINQPIDFVKNIDNGKIIALYSKGISGVVFVNAGLSHTITDASGENIEPVQIGEITGDGIVKCAPNSSHDYQSGDWITFINTEGEGTEQLEIDWCIKVINKTTFQLEDFNKYINKPINFINGTSMQFKKPFTISHQTFEQQLLNPNIMFNFDMELSKGLVNTYIEKYSNKSVFTFTLPEYAKTFEYEIIPVVSLMGSITASEAIKLVTNKYMPIDQWFTWTDPALLSKDVSIEDYNKAKTTYGKMYGLELEDKLINSKWLMVGSGAIGCEHLKNLAFMNVGNTNLGSGSIILTDPDSIEKSNLNRQFLFRSHHIGKPKSETAALAINSIKSNINIIPKLDKVGSDNMTFTDSILSGEITGVLNALDNIHARKFMDEQCFKYNLPLFESGTTGTKGNTQPVIPFITETYSASADPDQDKTFPLCTIKSFPNEIQHTIHWAMDQFELFNRAPSTINKWLINEKYLDSLSQIERTIAMEDINLFTKKYPTQINGLYECAKWAVDMFTENYYNNIIQLLHVFKPDHEVAPGVLFWAAGKRCPTPIEFNINNTTHMEYIESTTHLIARSCGIDDTFTQLELYNLIKDYKPLEYIPKKIKIASTDDEIKNIVQDENVEIELGDKNKFTNTFISQEFEKDDDSNWHINWITSASNIRALNYGINIADRQKTKGIAGRIIPAIATTTSAVSGLILIEMLKYLMDIKKIELYRSTFINLAQPLIVYSEPFEPQHINVGNTKLNGWTKFTWNKNTTLGEFKKYYDELFKTNITLIVIETGMIYADFLGTEPLDKQILEIITEHYETSDFPSIVSFSLATEDENIVIPNIQVIIS